MARHHLRRLKNLQALCGKRVSFLSKNPFQRLFSAASSKMELYGAKREEPDAYPLSERYLLKTDANFDRGFYPRARGAPKSAPKETRNKYPKLEETPKELIDRVDYQRYPQRLACLSLKGLPRLGLHYPAHRFLKEENGSNSKMLDFGFKDYFLREKIFIQYWKSLKQFQFALWGLLDHIRRSSKGASVLSRRVVRSYAYDTPHRTYLPKEGFPIEPKDILSMSVRARVFQFLRKY